MIEFTVSEKTNIINNLSRISEILADEPNNEMLNVIIGDIETFKTVFIGRGKELFYSQLFLLLQRIANIQPLTNGLLQAKIALQSIWNELSRDEKFHITNPTGLHLKFPIVDPLLCDLIGVIEGRVNAIIITPKYLKFKNYLCSKDPYDRILVYFTDVQKQNPFFELRETSKEIQLKFYYDTEETKILRDYVLEQLKEIL